jgi:putative hydrolase of the HAD superfamily
MSEITAQNRIEVVLFDVGGVLLTNGWDHRERAAVYAHFGLTTDEQTAIEARHLAPNDAWERDAITTEAYLDQAVFFTPRRFTRDEFFTQMKTASQPLADSARRTLEALAASNRVMVGLLNNESRDLHEARMKTFGLGALVRFQFSSCYLGLRKPNPAIYRRALDILGLPGSRVLFLDDREENVVAARAQGMRAIRFTGESALQEALSAERLL